MIRMILITLLSMLAFQASAMDIEEQILKIRNASDSDRYQLVNELKRELSKLGRNERVGAIIALKQQLSASQSDANTLLVSGTTKSELKQGPQAGQRNILNNFPSVAAVADAQGSGMVGNVNTVPPAVDQVAPPRPPSTVPVPRMAPSSSTRMMNSTQVVG